jgi:hypothetical protein
MRLPIANESHEESDQKYQRCSNPEIFFKTVTVNETARIARPISAACLYRINKDFLNYCVASYYCFKFHEEKSFLM